MKTKIRSAILQPRRSLILGMGATIAAYVVSPYVALWSIDQALNNNRPAQLATHIDWTALSRSLKEQVLSVKAVSEDDLPDFGSSFADAAASHAIDIQLSPVSVMTTARHMMGQPNGSWTISGVWHGFHAHFISLRRFEATLDQPGQPPLTLHMTFEQWCWKITRLEVSKVTRLS